MIPQLSQWTHFRQNRITREQAHTVSQLARVIALGRLPDEHWLSRKAALTRLIAALVMSTALWVYVTDQDNPVIRSTLYSLQVRFAHIPKGLIPSVQAPTVTVYARGLQSTVSSAQQISPVVDLSGAPPSGGAVTAPVTIEGGLSGVEYTSQPASITVQLVPYVSKSVQVTFNDQSLLPATLQLTGQTISPSVLTIAGPAAEVDRVNSATVEAPSASIAPPSPTATQFTYTFTEVPLLLDSRGRQLSTADLLPITSRVSVTMRIAVRLQLETLAVAPVPTGNLPAGYQLDSLQVSPQTVTVLGPPTVINGLTAVTTQPIPLQEITQTTTLTVSLDLGAFGEGVILYDASNYTIVGGTGGKPSAASTVQVQVTVSKQRASDFLLAAIKVDHVAAGLQAITNTQWESIYLTGPILDIRNLGPLTAHLDASGLGEGTYYLKPNVGLPPSLQTYALTPPTVQVRLLPRPTQRK